MKLNVIITGASRGLGLATARLLALEGYSVIGVARNSTNELAAAIAEVEAGKKGAFAFRTFDLTAIAEIPSFVRGLRQSFGDVYGLVNNAGLGSAGVLVNMPTSKVEALAGC